MRLLPLFILSVLSCKELRLVSDSCELNYHFTDRQPYSVARIDKIYSLSRIKVPSSNEVTSFISDNSHIFAIFGQNISQVLLHRYLQHRPNLYLSISAFITTVIVLLVQKMFSDYRKSALLYISSIYALLAAIKSDLLSMHIGTGIFTCLSMAPYSSLYSDDMFVVEYFGVCSGFAFHDYVLYFVIVTVVVLLGKIICERRS